MRAPADVNALAAAIRDHRPNLADEGATTMWFQLVGTAGRALFGDDERTRERFHALCEVPMLH